MHTGKIYFKNLDSIRFIAALIVFMSHAITPSYEYLSVNRHISKILFIISTGGTGVLIFFVLSGFLITHHIMDEYEANASINLKNFYLRRTLRIWPLYFVVIFVTFFLYPLKTFFGMSNDVESNFWYHLTFLSNFDVMRTQASGSNEMMSQSITWSVSIEEQFYLFWPLIFAFLPKRFWVHSILLVMVGSVCFRMINYHDKPVLYFHTFSVLIYLGMGGLIAYLSKSNSKVKAFFESCSTRTHLFLFILLFSMMVVESMPIPGFKYHDALTTVLVSMVVAAIIAAQALTRSQSFLNLSNLKFANRWGKYTYGIYLIHPIVMLLVHIVTRSIGIPNDNFLNLFSMGVASFILTLFFSKLSYTYYESWFLSLKEKFNTSKVS